MSPKKEDGFAVVGIDPGLEGYLVYLHGSEMLSEPMPVILPAMKMGRDGKRKRKGKREIDRATIRRILVDWAPNLVVLEKPQTRPDEHRGSGARSHYNAGLLEGICVGLAAPNIVVTPQRWHGWLKKLAGDASDPKVRARLYAESRWPQVDWRRTARCTTPSQGKIDAALLALYGEETHHKDLLQTEGWAVPGG